jgi:hypothetical protein
LYLKFENVPEFLCCLKSENKLGLPQLNQGAQDETHSLMVDDFLNVSILMEHPSMVLCIFHWQIVEKTRNYGPGIFALTFPGKLCLSVISTG